MQYEDPLLINEKIKTIDCRIIATILFSLTTIVSIILLYNKKLDIQGKEPIFNERENKSVNIVNTTIVFVLISYIQYLNYHERNILGLERKSVGPINLSIDSTYLLIAAALISMYAAYSTPTAEEQVFLV